jgi:glycosyltransferase involved in cell wall biosynthesis
MTSPKLSIVMGVFNASATVASAIQSILDQTFTDFELIVIDDGSSDNTLEIIKGFEDERIRVFNNDHNLGLAATLNFGINNAVGEFVGRMDADDLSLPDRFSAQLDFLTKHPRVGVVGGWVRTKQTGKVWESPTQHEQIKATLLFNNPIFHPTVVFRKEILTTENQYNQKLKYAQDYEFWNRLAQVTRLANLGRVVVEYNYTEIVNQDKLSSQQNTAKQIWLQRLEELGIQPGLSELETHVLLTKPTRPQATPRNILKADKWLRQILQSNLTNHVFDQVALLEVCQDKLIRLVNRSGSRKLIKIRLLLTLSTMNLAQRLTAVWQLVWHHRIKLSSYV